MAPRRVPLLLLVVAAAVCSLLTFASSPGVVVHAARDDPSSPDHVPAAETSSPGVQVQPPTVDDGGVPGGALNGVPPHLIHPAVLADAADPAIQRTVYDVTIIFRATARLGPPRLQYYVVPADAHAPLSAADDRKAGGVDVAGAVMFSLGLLLGVLLGAMGVLSHAGNLGDLDDEPSGGAAAAATKRPEEVALPQDYGAAAKPRGRY